MKQIIIVKNNYHKKIYSEQITMSSNKKSEKDIEGLNYFAIYSVEKYFQLSYKISETTSLLLIYMPCTWILSLVNWLIVSRKELLSPKTSMEEE